MGTNTVQAGETRAGLLADEKTQRTRLNQIERALKMPETAAIDLTVPTASPTDDTDRSRRSSTRKSKATEHFDFTKVNADQQAKQHEVKISKEMAKQSGPPPRQKSAAEIEEENERQGALAIQVVTDAAGIVTYLHSAGRPPSPFASTMARTPPRGPCTSTGFGNWSSADPSIRRGRRSGMSCPRSGRRRSTD